MQSAVLRIGAHLGGQPAMHAEQGQRLGDYQEGRQRAEYADVLFAAP